MPEAAGPQVVFRTASRGAAGVTLLCAALLIGCALDVPVLRTLLPQSLTLRADTALMLALGLLVVFAAALWWNTRSLVQAEARILHRDRLYSMLSHCNQAIVHARSADDLLPQICRIACEEGEFRLAWIGWLDDSSGKISTLAKHGDESYIDAREEGAPPAVPVSPETTTDDPVSECIRRAHHVVVNDVQHAAGTAHWLVRAKRHGVGSLASFPVLFQGRASGALTVYSSQAGSFGHDELRLLDEVAGDVSFALDTFDREAQRRAAEESLRETTHMLQTLVDASPLAIVVIDASKRVLLWSPAAERMFGWSGEEAVGKVLPIVPEEDVSKMRASRPDRQFAVERRRQRKDGTPIDVNLWSSPLQDAGGSIIGTLGILADVTERKQFERQIRQSQKLDALGTIAGGIAHDFNNILTVLRGNLSLAQMTLPSDHGMRVSLSEMDQACNRAADLVRQILTFGRQQEQLRQVITLQPVVQEAMQLLRSTIPSGITIETHIPPNLPTVMADRTQIHQVILNLGINASHAMESQRGRLVLSLEALDVDLDLAATCPELHPGRYVRLSVEDTGSGMDRETLDRIFEPFFTTKTAGRGTGLGLAVVRGIVKNHDGAITVTSEPGRGTHFAVYFPVVDGEVTGKHAQVVEALHGNGERVLFLDDEEPLVRLASRMLERLGYRVEAHTSASDALAVFRSRPGEFDLVLTDLSMPGASGIDFARSVLDIRPEVPVILTTGYIDPDDLDLVQRIGVREVILKPTTIEEMGRSFRRLLSSPVQ
ncbi:MAG: ATP-binding protein [Gammaproteobacteria bacterium]